ncbi:sulfurtransferase complex subunit TusB [Arsenophonus symbiont of Ornithomya chloropus]|uniref:sulfurtransferase complex subunit TusB n=1 Tax=Arsenophonus symbiont of Ornithomya chloropus TaxID=634121 RepID=UPI0032B16842
MLYSISTSPYYTDMNSLISLVMKEDELLLMQDGVLMGHKKLLNNNDNYYLMQFKKKGIHVFALQDDIKARGLIPYISSYIHQISFIDFVELTVKHTQYFSW